MQEQVSEATVSVPVGVTEDTNNCNGKCLNLIGLRLKPETYSRCVDKDGGIKFGCRNLDQRIGRNFNDIVTSLVELRWRWVLLGFCVIYFGSWLAFAFLWQVILWVDSSCISNITSFAETFMFSVETQHTTGYGHFTIQDYCNSGIILFCIQSITGVIVEGLCVGLVFVKVVGGRRRRATLIFSKAAVISNRDGKRCLMFRIADVRSRTQLLHTQVRLSLIRTRVTEEGEIIHYDQEDLRIHDPQQKNGQIFLFWPVIIAHIIDNSSPLRNLNSLDLTLENTSFEIIIILEGVVEATGQTVQARSSYLPSEILWGHRFQDIHTRRKKSDSTGERQLDYSLFHDTYAVGDHITSALET